jgi:hypothetical protein
LKELLLVLKEAGIAEEASTAALASHKSEKLTLDNIRDMLISVDVSDAEFNRLSDTKPDEYRLPERIEHYKVVLTHPKDGKTEFPVVPFPDPSSVVDSYDLTTLCYMGHYLRAHPVFHGQAHRREMEYRFERFKQGLKLLPEYEPLHSVQTAEVRLGEVAFQIVNDVYAAGEIARLTPENVVRLHRRLSEARSRYASSALWELTLMLEGNPWDQRFRTEVDKYIHGKLEPELQKFNENSTGIWERLVGRLTVHAAQIAKSSAIGGGVAGLAGSVVPGASFLDLVLFGILAGAGKEAPDLVKTLVDTALEARAHRRSALACIAGFRKK